MVVSLITGIHKPQTSQTAAGNWSGNAETATESTSFKNWPAVYPLLFLLLSVFMLTQSQGASTALATSLKFNVSNPVPWQLVTSAFSHLSMEHLAQNVFLVYVLGKITETTHGGLALWLAYLGSAAGGHGEKLVVD